jgi:hypothetical protein
MFDYLADMTTGLTLLLIVAGAYFAAHVAFDWLGRRLALISGAEYLALGILLGPEVSGLINASMLDSFAPFMTLALGWIGASVGARYYLPALVRVRALFYKVAFLESTISLVVTSGVMAFVLAGAFGEPLAGVIPAAVALGAIGVASSPSGVAFAARRIVRRGGVVVRQIEVGAGVNAFVAISIFAILLCLLNEPTAAWGRAPTATELVVISVGIGVIGGALFHLFLGDERHVDRLFIGLSGAIILATGAAAFLRLSPLLPTMLIGMMLVNTSRNRDQIRETLSKVERPFYFVLLLFAGAAWHPQGGIAWIGPILVFVASRFVIKLGSARLAARAHHVLELLGPDWGRALLGHGEIAVAIALNYHVLHESLPMTDLVFTAAIVSVLATDIASARRIRALLGRLPRSLRVEAGDA